MCRVRRAGERVVQRVPGERGALHPRRKILHPGEHLQLAEVARGRVGGLGAGEQRMHIAKQRLDVLDRLALDRLGHQRGRRGGDRAAVADEARLAHDAVLDLHIYGELVAAQRVVAVGVVAGGGQRAVVTRVAVVIEDHSYTDS